MNEAHFNITIESEYIARIRLAQSSASYSGSRRPRTRPIIPNRLIGKRISWCKYHASSMHVVCELHNTVSSCSTAPTEHGVST